MGNKQVVPFFIFFSSRCTCKSTMRPQQDFSTSSCSYCCAALLSYSFLLPLCLPSHYPFTSLVVFPCFLFPLLVRIALLSVAMHAIYTIRHTCECTFSGEQTASSQMFK